MKIAMIGTRGVPANYGGFETCVEELGQRLAKKGHEVTVYCRDNYFKEKLASHMGMELVYLPNIKRKTLDTLSHTFLSALHAIRRKYDILMVFNAANSPVLVLPWLFGRKMAINTDGLEWKRGKWGVLAKRYYKFSEWFSTKIADAVVADSASIQDYYLKTYNTQSYQIAYGAYPATSTNPGLLAQFGLKPKEYFLQVTRFEPENNPLLTVKAFKNRDLAGKKLVVVGGVPYKSEYSMLISAEKNNHVLLPGAIYDKKLLNEIWCNCYAYIHGNEVGGTNPALLQAMANRCFVLSIDVPFNRDVLDSCGIFFEKSVEGLASKLDWAVRNGSEFEAYKSRALKRISELYSWDRVTDQYEKMFEEIIRS